MLDRFEGDAGRRLLIEALAAQKMVAGNRALAAELATAVVLRGLAKGERLIEQGASDNAVFFVIAGSVDIVVNGRSVNTRRSGDHVGEMAAVEPTQPRSASVVTNEPTVVAVITEPHLAALGAKYPEIYQCIAKELSRRLMQRNALVSPTHDRIRLFIISSAEALDVARAVQNALERDVLAVVWTDGVFRVTSYALESLEEAVDGSDFAVAIAHADDVTESRDKSWPSPRDNVIFELGLFMGRLGRQRAILMEPRGEGVKLPSDLAGITTIPYRFEKGEDMAALMAPACNMLRDHIKRMGPNN